jgi:small subunit ribosomal protein S18
MRRDRDEGKGRRKPCVYCKAGIKEVDYKKFRTLRLYISDRGKLRSQRVTGLCRRHQSQVATATKRAREVALLPYVRT